MALEAFLKVDGIEGDEQDDKHKNEIRVLEFNLELAQPPSDPGHAGYQSVGRANFGPLTIFKQLDKSSPLLAQACASGKPLASVRLELCRSEEDNKPYMEYKLTDAMVTYVKPHGKRHTTGQQETLPTEEVRFAYGEIDWKYTQTGKSSGNVAAGWNVATNKKK